MEKDLLFIFKSEDIRRLLEKNTDYIVIRSFLKTVVSKDGAKNGALKVYADAVQKGNTEAVFSVPGCPMPPCTIHDDPKSLEM